MCCLMITCICKKTQNISHFFVFICVLASGHTDTLGLLCVEWVKFNFDWILWLPLERHLIMELVLPVALFLCVAYFILQFLIICVTFSWRISCCSNCTSLNYTNKSDLMTVIVWAYCVCPVCPVCSFFDTYPLYLVVVVHFIFVCASDSPW